MTTEDMLRSVDVALLEGRYRSLYTHRFGEREDKLYTPEDDRRFALRTRLPTPCTEMRGPVARRYRER
jgi:hypothetical protein